MRSYSYDDAGRIESRTDSKSQTTSYSYNDRNQLTLINYPTDTDTSFAYNDAGLRTSMTDGTGTTTYSYDDLYHLTSVTFPGARTVGYTYDAAGRQISIAYPGGSNQVAYAYDAANRLSSVTDWDSNVIAYTYDDANRMTATTLPSGTGIVSSFSYDDADRLTGISHVKGGSTTVASVAYTLDGVGNRTQRVDQQGAHTYAYDGLYRLTSVTYPGPATTSYTFDAFGNRTSMTDGSGTTDYTYDDADRLTEADPPSASAVAYTWDDNGNLTDRGSDEFAWDEADRMVSATVNSMTTTFAYRGDGLRESRTVGMSTTTFTWDVNAGLPVVLNDGNQYLYGLGLEAMEQSGDWYYFLADGLGSTMAIVDDTGAVQNSYTYDVYGAPTVTGSLQNEFDFAGQQTDGDTGLQYLRARYMDPETGVFLSRDPLAVEPCHYGYAGGNPATATDPTGLWPEWPGGGVCETFEFMWTPCEETSDAIEGAGNAVESLTEIFQRAGYIDANATIPIGFGVVITAGCQVASDNPGDVHCYLGGGFGNIGLSISLGPGQTIVDGWSCGASVSAGAPISVGVQVGAAGIDVNEYEEEVAEPFGEYGIGTPGFSSSVTCYYVGRVGAWWEIISGMAP